MTAMVCDFLMTQVFQEVRSSCTGTFTYPIIQSPCMSLVQTNFEFTNVVRQ